MANNQTRTGVNYSELLDQVSAEQQKINVELIHVGPMSILAPDANWVGAITITGERELTAEEDVLYLTAVQRALVATVNGGQRACMDGRGTSVTGILPGPKTAGGTQGDATRILLASYAAGEPMEYVDAVQRAIDIEDKLGYLPGGHELGQCGAIKFAPSAITATAQSRDLTARAAATFHGAVGLGHSESVQSDVYGATQTIVSKLDSLFPDNETATALVSARNKTSNPVLDNAHLERDILVFLNRGVTLDNNALIDDMQKTLGKEVQAFAYNWAHHLDIANGLGSKLGEYYLHAVPTLDAHTLTNLTDGTVRITAVK